MKKAKQLLMSSAAIVLLSVSTAQAKEPVSLEAMQKQIELLSQQVSKLSDVVTQQGEVISAQKAQIKAQNEKTVQQGEVLSQKLDQVAAARAANIAPAAGGNEPAPVKITMNPSPKIESADGKYSFQPFGRVHFDTTFWSDDRSDQADNVNFRRARLGFKGNLGEDFNYKAEYDFGGEAVNLKEVYLAYTGFKPAEIWVGNFKPPVGLEQNTSTNYMSFLENSAVTSAFTRDEIIGAVVKTGGENWSLAGGVFNEDAGVNTGTADEGFSLDARGSVDLLQDSPNVLHVGLGGSLRKPNSAGGGAVTVSAKPAGVGPNFITTGAVAGVERSFVYGPELAAVFGPFHAQGEYMIDTLSRHVGQDVDLRGWYAQAGFFLTGETRPYKGKTGNFERVKPKNPVSLKNGGWGAWEALVRYDDLDLNDAGVNGGEMKNWAFGVNWYMTDYIRMMFDVTKVNTDARAVTANDEPTLYNMRVQWDF
jgi:phosphate-selective porin OprO/OprP